MHVLLMSRTAGHIRTRRVRPRTARAIVSPDRGRRL